MNDTFEFGGEGEPSEGSADRNKTELTQNVTRQVALWLDGKGFKPVETEVGVTDGWVADVAGVCTPTQTELIDLKLVPRPPRWKYQGKNDGFEKSYAAWSEMKDAIPSLLTATVEVKTSVGDFRADTKWTREWPTNLCYVAMPEGMIPAEQWPEGWGVILFSQQGTTIRRVFPSKCRAVTTEQQLNTVLSLAVVRDNKTRYARIREHQKKVRIEDGHRKTVARIQSAIGMVKAVLCGQSVDRAALYHGIRTKLPDYVRKELESLRPPGSPPEGIDEVHELRPRIRRLLHLEGAMTPKGADTAGAAQDALSA